MKRIYDPWLGSNLGSRYVELYDSIELMARKLDAAKGGQADDRSLRRWFSTLEHPRVAISIMGRPKPAATVSRLEQMFRGPLFTSAEFPWPRTTRWKNGRKVPADSHCVPVFQIDLSWLSELSGLDLGSDIVQVWMDGIDPVTRVIPRPSFTAAELTPIEPEVVKFFSGRRPEAYISFCEWHPESSVASWIETAYVVARVGKAEHAFSDEARIRLDDLSSGQFQSDQEVEYQGSEEEAQHILMLERRLNLNEELRAKPNDEEVFICRLFGPFWSVQNLYDEYYNGNAFVLVDMSDSTLFNFGSGNAQLIADFRSPAESAFFTWSC